MNIEEKTAHRNMWYHISRKLSSLPCERRPITSAIVSNSSSSMTKEENLLLIGIPVSPEVRNNDNSLAVRDDDDKDNVREVTARSLSTGTFNNCRIMMMPLSDLLLNYVTTTMDADDNFVYVSQ